MNNGFTEEQLKQFDDWMHGKWSQHGEDGIENIMREAVQIAEHHQAHADIVDKAWKGDETINDFINQPITGKEMCFVIRMLAYLHGVTMLYKFDTSIWQSEADAWLMGMASDAAVYYEWCRLGYIAPDKNGTWNIQRDWFGLMTSGIPADLIWDIEIKRNQKGRLLIPSNAGGRELVNIDPVSDNGIMALAETSQHAAFQLMDGPTATPTHALSAFRGLDGVIHVRDPYHNGQDGTEDHNVPMRDLYGKKVGRWLIKAGSIDLYGLYLALVNTAADRPSKEHQKCMFNGMGVMLPDCLVSAAYCPGKASDDFLCGNPTQREKCRDDLAAIKCP